MRTKNQDSTPLHEWLNLAWRSLLSRKVSTFLTFLSILISVTLLLGIERVRLGARESFSSTVSHTDLIVGGRSGSIALLLYSVFHIGNATNNIDMESYNHFSQHPAVKWTIPLSMGDSHKGFRVIATDDNFLNFYKFGENNNLKMVKGKWFKDPFDVVIGAEVSRKLSYELGAKIVVAHGQSEIAVTEHDDKPFTISGILEPTGTPVDRGVFVSLTAMEAIHTGWSGSTPQKPHQITSFLLGAHSRLDSLKLQREINDYEDEPLLAILPALTLEELWSGVSYAENALRLVAVFVVFATVISLFISLYSTLNERRREMAILRAVGASPGLLLLLLVFESSFLTMAGCFFGSAFTFAVLYIMKPLALKYFGLYLPIVGFHSSDWTYLLLIIIIGILVGFGVGYKAYRNSLHDGLST